MRAVAPPIEGQTWISAQPLSPGDFSGRVMLIAFWSLGCQASIQMLREVEDLMEMCGDRASALAVHTPRLPYEESAERCRASIIQHRIQLPVLHDPDYVTWNRYNPGGWPAVAVVDPRGRVVGLAQGLDALAVLGDVLGSEMSRPERNRRAASKPKPPLVVSSVPTLRGEPALVDGSLQTDTSLWFPEAVAVRDQQVAVADTGNDRLLLGSLDHDLRTFRPEVEITDIDQPSAVAFADDDLIYAIERGSRSVLKIDLLAGTVDVMTDGEIELPTALMVDQDGSLVVADAGTDRLIRVVGSLDETIILEPIAGNGQTGCDDGPAGKATLAQPVAVARLSTGIAFCDAASSNVRLRTDKGSVHTVTGSGFYEWGLVDGPAHDARFQRPGGLAVANDGSVAVTDTGNGRIRIISDRTVRTLGLNGLDQPTGLAALESGQLLIADTGNHRLVVADIDRKTGWPVAVYPATMTSLWTDEAPIID